MYELDLLCFDEPFRFSLRSMRRYTAMPGAIVLVADASTTLAGFIIVSHDQRDQTGYLITLDVHPAFRRQGLARILTSEAEQLAVVAGLGSIQLHVHTGNRAAISFYESLGYMRQSYYPGFYASDLDAWTYAKALQPDTPIS